MKKGSYRVRWYSLRWRHRLEEGICDLKIEGVMFLL